MSQVVLRSATRRPVRKSTTRIERPRPLHEAVVDRLRDMILDGEFAVGERLHDAKLAEVLGVSRTPVREATKLLAGEGLVDLLPGRGARVAAFSLDGLIALVEVIAGLERHACELAAERMSAQDLAALQRLHDRMAEHHRTSQRREYSRLNHEIHVGLVALAGNEALSAMHAGLIARARRGRHHALESEARWHEAMAEHEAIMAALAARDGRQAGERMLLHDLHTRDVLRDQLTSRSVATG
jgi:DNA-binding GntR family transcriptional regulator